MSKSLFPISFKGKASWFDAIITAEVILESKESHLGYKFNDLLKVY